MEHSVAIDRFVEELDPRKHVATKAFFEVVKPEVASKIAEHQQRWNRQTVELAIALRELKTRFLAELDPGMIENPTKEIEDFDGGLYDLLLATNPMILSGHEEYRALLGALRGLDDDGLYIAMYEATTNLCCELIENVSVEAPFEGAPPARSAT